jgi:hypothetical protein
LIVDHTSSFPAVATLATSITAFSFFLYSLPLPISILLLYASVSSSLLPSRPFVLLLFQGAGKRG